MTINKHPALSELIAYKEKLNEKVITADIAREVVKRDYPGFKDSKTIASDLSRLSTYKSDTKKVRTLLTLIKESYPTVTRNNQTPKFEFKMKNGFFYYIYYYYSFTERRIKPGIFEIKNKKGEWGNGILYYLRFDSENYKVHSKYILEVLKQDKNFIYYKGVAPDDSQANFYIINLLRTYKNKRYVLFATYNGLVAYDKDKVMSSGKSILVQETDVMNRINEISRTRSVEPWIENILLFTNKTVLVGNEGKGYKDKDEFNDELTGFNQYKCSLSLSGYYVGYYLRKDINSDEGGLIRVLLELRESSKSILYYREFEDKMDFSNIPNYKGFFYFPLKTDNALIKGEFQNDKEFGYTSRIITFIKTITGKEMHGLITGKKRQGSENLFSSVIIFKKIGDLNKITLEKAIEKVAPLRIPKSKLPTSFLWDEENISLQKLKDKFKKLCDEYFETIDNCLG